MIKYISLSDFRGSEVYLIDNAGLEKMAAEHVVSEAIEYARALRPNGRVFYCVVVALGAGEYWGANRNGDYFPESELLKSYKTFEQAHVYRLHQNKDPKRSIGRVLKAFWNDRMKRVELVLELDREKAADILERLEHGETVDVSMGCKVDYDICSICGHKSKSRAEYCEHLKFHMGKILPDGRQVFAINPNPKFFDLSFVRRGADPSAKVLLKVASEKPEKDASISKKVPAMAVVYKTRYIPVISWATLEKAPMLPASLLRFLARYPIEDVAYSLALLGIPLKVEEFRRLIHPLLLEYPLERLVKLFTRARARQEILESIPEDVLEKRSFLLIEPVIEKVAMNVPDVYEAYQRGVIFRLKNSGSVKIATDEKLLKLILLLKRLLSPAFSEVSQDERWYLYDIPATLEEDTGLAQIDLSSLNSANILGNYLLYARMPERFDEVGRMLAQLGMRGG